MSVNRHLRDVMKESIQPPVAYVRSRSHALGIHPSRFEKKDIHGTCPGARRRRTVHRPAWPW